MQVLWCEHWGGCHKERRVGVTKFHFSIILGLVIMSWFCSGQPNIRCVFHSPVFFLVSQPLDRIQTLPIEQNLKKNNGSLFQKLSQFLPPLSPPRGAR